MHEGAAVPSWVLLAYLVAGICFIIALRGLSSPSTSQRGNRFGMIGMLIAVLTTFATNVPFVSGASLAEVLTHEPRRLAPFGILAASAVGAVIGLTTAKRIQMTAMP